MGVAKPGVSGLIASVDETVYVFNSSLCICMVEGWVLVGGVACVPSLSFRAGRVGGLTVYTSLMTSDREVHRAAPTYTRGQYWCWSECGSLYMD